MKRIKTFVVLAVCLLLCSSTVYAQSPYLSFDDTEWNSSATAPEGYEAANSWLGIECGTTPFVEPNDLCMDDKGQMYVLDSGNDRVVILDTDMQMVGDIKKLTHPDGTASSFNESRGICVDSEGNLYVADTSNSRVIKMDIKGNVLQQYLRPNNSAYTSKVFRPLRVSVDGNGMVYVAAEGVYQGLLLYKNNGDFHSFFGSAPVDVTAQLLIERLWKQILNRQMRDTQARYVPIEYASLDMDADGMVYTVSAYSKTQQEQVRKLNYLGNNIYPYQKNFGESETVYHKGSKWISTFVDVAVDSEDYVFVLDSTRCRVYMFDAEGNRLCVFGTMGEQMGSFRNPVALTVFEESVYVLDRSKGSITCFTPSEYGSRIREAVTHYNDGRYEQAASAWKTLLSYNANLELAYCGLGEAMLKSGEYKAAVEYFRQGYDRERESVAFGMYRNQLLRQNAPVLIALLVLVVVVLALLTSRSFLGFVNRKWKNRKRGEHR